LSAAIINHLRFKKIKLYLWVEAWVCIKRQEKKQIAKTKLIVMSGK
jgi:hypothetical protein